MAQTYELVEDASYFRKVLGNMRSCGLEGCTVQFGETGKGASPHYMLTDANNTKHLYRGTNHGDFKDSSIEEFSASNLSQPLTVKQVQEQIGIRRTTT
jgi:hypothetical protein